MKKPKLSDFTISEAAEELRIRREHVLALLKSGALQGYDVTPPGAKRKSYRITRQALDDFKAGRSAQQHKATRRSVKPKRDASYVEYFS
jgi:excisionase family DNA binding protein